MLEGLLQWLRYMYIYMWYMRKGVETEVEVIKVCDGYLDEARCVMDVLMKLWWLC